MADRLLCAVDCTPASRGTVRAALAVAEAMGMRIVLVHVVQPGEIELARPGARGAWALERSLREIQLPADASRRIEIGDPAECILSAAEDEDAAVILTGTRSVAPRKKALFGSVASAVIERSPVPVVVAPEGCCHEAASGRLPQTHEVIIGVDSSARGLEAARVGASLARQARASAVLAHVIAPVTPAAAPPVGIVPPLAPSEREEAAAWSLLEEARRSTPDPEGVEVKLRRGLPAEQLERLAAQRGADVIVLGSSRPGRFRRLLFGSTAERLAQDTNRLLMIVPCGVSEQHVRQARELQDGQLIPGK